jgi:hypothetical protein
VLLTCDHPRCARLESPVFLHRKDVAPRRLRLARHRRWREHWGEASEAVGLPVPESLPENLGPIRPLEWRMADWRTQLMGNGIGEGRGRTTGDCSGVQHEFPRGKCEQALGPQTRKVAFSLLGMGLGDRVILEAPLRVHRKNRPDDYRIAVVQNGEGPEFSETLRRQFDEVWRLPSGDGVAEVLRPAEGLNDALIDARVDEFLMPFWNPLSLPANSPYRQSPIDIFANARELQREGIYPELAIVEDDRNWARGLLAALGIDRFGLPVAVHLRQVVYDEERNLAVETVRAIIEALRRRWHPAFLFLGRDDSPPPLSGADIFSFVGQNWPLEKTAAVLAESCLFLGGESGLTHAAAAVGIPVIGLGYVGRHARPFSEAGRSICFEKGEGLPIIMAGVARFVEACFRRPVGSSRHGD